jgi:hypothetical protein
MVRKTVKTLSLILCITLVNCSNTQYREQQSHLKNLMKNQKFHDALKFTENKNFLQEENSVMLKYMEKGIVAYSTKQYYKALKTLDTAHAISINLQSKRISSKINSIIDENHDIYYGLSHEISLIRFYQSLAHYNIYITGKYEKHQDITENGKIINIPEKILNDSERKNHLYAARSVIIEWDSFLSAKVPNENDVMYSEDILLKIWGSYIHSQIPGDKQIAIQLLHDAKKILNYKYAILPSFNEKSNEFVKNIKNLTQMTSEEKSNLITQTDYSKKLNELIDLQLSKLQNNQNNNLIVILQDSITTTKDIKYKTVDLPINFISVPLSGSSDIKFELLDIKTKTANYKYKIILKNKANLTKEINLELIQPLSDIAFRTIEEKMLEINTKATARVTAKYIAAIAAAIAVYEASEDKVMGLIQAQIIFATSSKLIQEKSKIDIRQCTSIPSNIFIANEFIEEGNYDFEVIKTIQTSEDISINKGTVIISKNTLLDIRI